MKQTETSLPSVTSGREAASFDSGASELRAQAGVYRLLARCLEEEPDQSLIDLFRGELREGLAEVGVKLAPEFFQADLESLLETLAEEYTGLFVAPGAAMPYASVCETGRLFQKPADQAVQAYREAGWEYHHQRCGEFPDHIGTMLGFVAILLEQQAVQLDLGDNQAVARCRQRYSSFMLDQLGRWAPGYCGRAAKAAFHVFYRDLLGLAERLLWSDLMLIADPQRLKELGELNRREPPKLDYDADFRKASGL